MSTDALKARREGDLGGMICAVLFIVVGIMAIYDTTSMSDRDSYVFPRTIAIAMIVFSIMLIAWTLIRPGFSAVAAQQPGSVGRRVGLVVAMLAGTALMPYLGMLISSIFAFVALMAVAMFDPWTRMRLIVFPIVGVAIVAGFYVLFAEVLQVPLPIGTLFE